MKNLRSTILVSAIAIVGLMASYYAYSWHVYTQVWNVIVFKLPDGYRGIFSVSEDVANGVSPASRLGSDGHPVYEVFVPLNGAVSVKSVSPFFGWNKYEVFYASGTQLPYLGSGDKVALRPLAVAKDRVYFLVGTLDESRRWHTDGKEWRTIEPRSAD